MPEKDITRIHVGDFSVSIVGIKGLMEEMAATHSGKTDEEVCSHMLTRLEKDNYIPAGAREEYGKAFVREFRRTLGQPYVDDAPRRLDVKVLGAGCVQCNHLTMMVMEVLNGLGIRAGVDHVTDFREIARYGVMGLPALLINGKVMAVGSVPPRDRIRKWLLEANGPAACKNAASDL
jgi:hypothetical protein